jgi:hypothetical protein
MDDQGLGNREPRTQGENFLCEQDAGLQDGPTKYTGNPRLKAVNMNKKKACKSVNSQALLFWWFLWDSNPGPSD